MSIAQNDGQKTYEAYCIACHQANGAGIPAAFPPLAGHTSTLLEFEGGRDYLINVLLYGLQGEIEAVDQTYNSAMPSWPLLNDEEVAAVLNYIITAWDNDKALSEDFEPFVAEEITQAREEPLSAVEVHELRNSLGASETQNDSDADAGVDEEGNTETDKETDAQSDEAN